MRTTDIIWLKGIAAHANHGVFDFERQNGQRFVLDVGFELDTRRAARTDSVDATVSYADVAAAVHAVLTNEPADLIETVAERMAAAALAFPGVTAATVVLHKPEAPLAVPFHDVALQIRRTPLTVVPIQPVPVVLALGGNIGDSRAIITAGVQGLSDELSTVRVGPLVRTAAMTLPGSEPQNDYLNTVVTAHTRLSASEVLELAQRVEYAHRRRRGVRWGPRTLDIDVIAYGDVVADHADLTLPHPGAVERSFVLVPWAALEPERLLDGRAVADRAAPFAGEILERWEDWR